MNQLTKLIKDATYFEIAQVLERHGIKYEIEYGTYVVWYGTDRYVIDMGTPYSGSVRMSGDITITKVT